MARSAAQANAQHRWYNAQAAREQLGDVKIMTARYAGTCERCHRSVTVGEQVAWNTKFRSIQCADCAGLNQPAAPVVTKICRECGTEKPADAKLANTARCAVTGHGHNWRAPKAA